MRYFPNIYDRTGSVQGAGRAKCRPQRPQARLDSGSAHPVSAQHLGRYAVPAHLLGGRAGRHHRVAGHRRRVGSGVRHYDVVAVCDLHQWRGEGRRHLLHYLALAGPGVWRLGGHCVCVRQCGCGIHEHDRFLRFAQRFAEWVDMRKRDLFILCPLILILRPHRVLRRKDRRRRH